jgi:hypothetical protein
LELKILYKVLTSHLTRYLAMQVQDIYKLLHQAALGSDHAVLDPDTARRHLERELVEMGEGPSEPLLDLISPNGQLARIHLRPYVRVGKDAQALLKAFIRTANEWRGSVATLRAYGKAAAQWSEFESWPIRRAEIETFFAKMEGLNFPAVHHSAIYADLYRPAYRVVAKRFLEEV